MAFFSLPDGRKMVPARCSTHPQWVGKEAGAAPGRQGDDTLAVADGDARANGVHLITGHGFRIDPHQQTGLSGSREAELPGGLL